MTTTKEQPEKLSVREPEAAKMMGVSPVTLKRWRAQGSGPRFKKVGNVVLYPVDAIRKYLKV